MKKSIIKRRKRVVPTTAGGEDIDEFVRSETPSQDLEGSPERGSLNDDGSINLGQRPGLGRLPPMLAVPATASNRQNTSLPPVSNLTGYKSFQFQSFPSQFRYLNPYQDRLVPMTSTETSGAGTTALTPTSLPLSPRKRAFSVSEGDSHSARDSGPHTSKRITSLGIRSILNPCNEVHSTTTPLTERESPRDSYRGIAATVISSPPSVGSHLAAQGATSVLASSKSHIPRVHKDREWFEAQRQALEREAQIMRVALAAKEKELATLGR